MTIPNYLPKILRLFDEGKLKKIGLSELTIRHDQTCRIYRGEPCNCDPDIYLGEEKLA